MHYLQAVQNQLFIIALLLATGFYLRKRTIIDDHMGNGFFIIANKVGIPCSIISNLQRSTFSAESFKGLATVFLLYMACSFIGFGVGLLLCKGFRIRYPERGLWLAAATSSNLSFIGQPLIAAIYGEEALFHFAATIAAGNIFVFSIILVVMGKKDSGERIKRSWTQRLKPLWNGVIIAAIVGIGLFLFSIRLPEAVNGTLSLLSAMTSPISMIGIGAMLVSANVKSLLSNYRIYVVTLLRLILAPLAAYFILAPFIKENTLLSMAAIGFGMPGGIVLPGMAVQTGNDAKFASEFIFSTTLLCMLTIPIIVYIIY